MNDAGRWNPPLDFRDGSPRRRAHRFVRLAALLWFGGCASPSPTASTAPTAAATVGSEAAVDPCDWESGGPMGLPRCPNTGDPLPADPVENPDCDDRVPGTTRWISMPPGTPLAVSDPEGGIRSATQSCCAPWARVGDVYHALDALGRPVGRARITGGEGYDVTACFELTFEVVEGVEGVGLYASSAGALRSLPAPAMQAIEAEAAALEAFLADAERLAALPLPVERRYQHDEPLPPAAERVIYFGTPAYDAEGRTVTRLTAVAGGRILVIAHLDASGSWILEHIENELARVDYGPRFAYRPLAVLDMDGDGAMEVVYHWDEGPSWGQIVLHQNPFDGWEPVAHGVGGATL